MQVSPSNPLAHEARGAATAEGRTMNRVARAALSATLRCALLMLILGVSSLGCKKREPERVPDVKVDASLEMVPPIATDVQIKRLENDPNGNVLLIANFGKDQIKGPFHAVEISSGKVVLRDDGKGGDEVPNDGLFSVALTEDLASLDAELETLQRNAKILQEKPVPVFKGRELLPPERAKFEVPDKGSFDKGAVVHINPKWLCLLFTDVSVDHSLMVTDVSVVEDSTRANNPCLATPSATGAWSFGKLVTDMANTGVTGVSPEDFVRQWLSTWLSTITVNGDSLPARTNLFDSVIKPWVIKSGGSSTVDMTNWMTQPLDLKFAPFKLIAIVNRLDLRGNMGYGMKNSGEGRFVFEVLDSSCAPLGPGGFTVIFEYGLPIHSCAALKAYAQKWYELKALTLGDPAYNTALQAITDVFALANADPSKPNGSALNQMRTNEVALGFPWELREFNIDGTSHRLVNTTVKQEPAKKYNSQAQPPGAPADVTLMANWVNTNASAVVLDRHKVPEQLTSSGPAFLGGKAHTEFGGFWDAAPLEITLDDARHHFSLNTCSGCHGGETQTSFLHVATTPFGSPAPLSGFLTGVMVPDPAGRPSGSPTVRSFNDLERRRADLADLLCTACIKRPIFEIATALTMKPINMTH